SVFVFAKPTGEIQQNGINIAADIEKIILIYNLEKVLAIIKDNASVMKKAWNILDKKYPKIVFIAILKKYQENKYGSNYKTFKLPVETRWSLAANCLDSIKFNQLAISLSITDLINHPTIS
ncbi:7848_t:CDS:2, partial [Dentiscutata heterogama]